jgi:hypothetical protein
MITQILRRLGIRADGNGGGNNYCKICGGFIVCRPGCGL